MTGCANSHQRKGLVSNQDRAHFDTKKTLASIATCDRPDCIARAVAYVESETGEAATYQPDEPAVEKPAKNPYVGETFRDKDSRSSGRRIRIEALHVDQFLTGLQRSSKPKLGGTPAAFWAIRVNELGEKIGKQRVRISTHTLDTRYEKVSH